MKKRTGVSIGIVVVIMSIIFGIASLPDEVLIESPSFDTSQNPSVEEKQITIPSESVSSKEETEPKEEAPVEPVEQTELEEETPVEPVEQTEPKEETPVEPVEQIEPEEETQGKVIEVKIRDGVGSKRK